MCSSLSTCFTYKMALTSQVPQRKAPHTFSGFFPHSPDNSGTGRPKPITAPYPGRYIEFIFLSMTNVLDPELELDRQWTGLRIRFITSRRVQRMWLGSIYCLFLIKLLLEDSWGNQKSWSLKQTPRQHFTWYTGTMWDSFQRVLCSLQTLTDFSKETLQNSWRYPQVLKNILCWMLEMPDCWPWEMGRIRYGKNHVKEQWMPTFL